MDKFKLIFGGLIAFVLLGLYVYCTVYAILAVNCLSGAGCRAYTPDLTTGVVNILTVIGGLVSATVITELALTLPGKAPGARLITAKATAGWVSAITIFYMMVWMICGVYSLVVGNLLHPDVVPVLTTAGKEWLGLAVAAAYSYFGVKP